MALGLSAATQKAKRMDMVLLSIQMVQNMSEIGWMMKNKVLERTITSTGIYTKETGTRTKDIVKVRTNK